MTKASCIVGAVRLVQGRTSPLAHLILTRRTIVKVNKTRRNVFAGLALAAVLGTTGCSAINPQATTFVYAPSDGTQVFAVADETGNAGSVDFLNIGVITNSADEPGRIMGVIHNKSSESQNVELSINNQSFSFSLDADEILSLEDEELVLDSVGTEPGQLADGVA